MTISLIIPTKNDYKEFKVTFLSVLKQTLLPDEIIIVDSSNNNLIKNFINENNTDIPIKYKKVNFAFPGKARNIGISMASKEFIAFLDAKTNPEKFWLEDSIKEIKDGDFDICFGNTKFLYKNYFQKLLRATSYGSVLHITTPGTILKRNIFKNKNYLFIENVKAGEDIEWRERLIDSNFKVTNLNHITIKYNSLPIN